MAGEQKRKARQVMVTKALLLGYTIDLASSSRHRGQYVLIKPDGTVYAEYVHRPPGYSQGPFVAHFAAPWVAAHRALILAGVIPDAKNTR